MGLTISARFVLGSYQGSSKTGQPESFPGTDRLLAALTAAAGTGPYAVESPSGLEISERHRAALEWLETKPPAKVSIPDHRMNAPNAVAYRKTGLMSKGNYAPAAMKAAIARSSLAGPMIWSWEDEPNPDVLLAVQELCAEVCYLGEAASLAVLDAWIGDDEELPGELVRVPEDELYPVAAVPITTPRPGRLNVLEAAHESARAPLTTPERAPSKNEGEQNTRWPDDALALVWYRPATDTSASRLPWDRALVLEVEPAGRGSAWPPPPSEFVAWCVALQRALVRALHPSVPALVSGHYGPDVPRPANRLAIQIVDQTLPLGWTLSEGVKAAFLLLLPSDCAPEDQDAVVQGLHFLAARTLYRGSAGAVKLSRLRPMVAQDFWAPTPAGTQRWWSPRPLAIADTRPIRTKKGAAWTLADALKLSVAMVWRDVLGVRPGKGAEFYGSLVSTVEGYLDIASLARLAGPDLASYVHRTGESVLLTGYRARFRMPSLVLDTAPAAIGQSRHLGTGLLVPSDRPPPTDHEGAAT